MTDIQKQMVELTNVPYYNDADNRCDFEKKLNDLIRSVVEECREATCPNCKNKGFHFCKALELTCHFAWLQK